MDQVNFFNPFCGELECTSICLAVIVTSSAFKLWEFSFHSHIFIDTPGNLLQFKLLCLRLYYHDHDHDACASGGLHYCY